MVARRPGLNLWARLISQPSANPCFDFLSGPFILFQELFVQLLWQISFLQISPICSSRRSNCQASHKIMHFKAGFSVLLAIIFTSTASVSYNADNVFQALRRAGLKIGLIAKSGNNSPGVNSVAAATTTITLKMMPFNAFNNFSNRVVFKRRSRMVWAWSCHIPRSMISITI